MCTERVLKGNVKAEFLQWINFIVANFTKVMATMTVHIFSTYANHNKRQFKQRYLRKPHKTKAWLYTTTLFQLNIYLLLLLYCRQTSQASLLYPYLIMTSRKFLTTQCQTHGKNVRTGIQLLRWFYPIYSRILSPHVLPQDIRTRKPLRKGIHTPTKFQGWKLKQSNKRH